MFRIKSRKKIKSSGQNKELVSHGNLYQCLSKKSVLDNEWKRILSYELDMPSTIVAFQMIEVVGRGNHKKLLVRKINVLKRSIIECIQKGDYDSFLIGLNELKESSNEYRVLAEVFILFYELRERLIGINYEFEDINILDIKNIIDKIHSYPEKEIQNIIYGRIIYIYALHLVRLEGALISNEHISLIVEALNYKKKELWWEDQIKKQVLESLLLFTFQFYRILRLLKRDQHLILAYYNQIKAYINIFRNKVGQFQQFEHLHQIEKKVETITPLYLNLKIYDDHDKRKSLSIVNTENQILNQNQLKPAPFNQTFNELKHTHSKNQDDTDDDIYLNELCSNILHNTLFANAKPQQFNFDFLIHLEGECLLGNFITQRIHSTLVKVKIITMTPYVQLSHLSFKFSVPPEITVKDFAKRLWTIVKSAFRINKEEFLSTLFCFDSPPDKDIPSKVDKFHELPFLMRIHSMIKYYSSRKTLEMKMNGKCLQMPKISQPFVESVTKVNENENRMFQKRKGFITNKSQGMQREQKERLLNLIILTLKNSHYNIIFMKFKENELMDVHIIEKYPYSPSEFKELNENLVNISLLAKLKSSLTLKEKKQEIINRVGQLQKKNPFTQFNQFDLETKETKIEEEFEVMRDHFLQSKQGEIKNLWSHSKPKPMAAKPQLKLLKISSQYWAMHFRKIGSVIHMSNHKQRLFIPENILNEYKLVYTRFRVYKNIMVKRGNQYVKYYQNARSIDPEALSSKRQKINLECRYSKIHKMGKLYKFISVYSRKGLNVIEVYDFKDKTYEYRLENNKVSIEFDKGSYEGKRIVSRRDVLCDAQAFYDNQQ